MMELWQACFFVLIVRFTSGRETTQPAHEIREIDSCPIEGYFFKKEPSHNQLSAGRCWLCFCQENDTATCWERDLRRCDVEHYHHHRIGRSPGRSRRSFTDIFLRDATRDFFNKNLPEECKPNISSFSDGCPPADWCVGCTVCDCDSSGHWDCHILSFCDGKEKKRKVKHSRLKLNQKYANNDSLRDVRSLKKPAKKTVRATTKKPVKNVKGSARSKPKNGPNKVVNKPGKKPYKNEKKSTKFDKKPTKVGKKPTKVGKKPTKVGKKSTKIGNKPSKIEKRPNKAVNINNKVQKKPFKVGKNNKKSDPQKNKPNFKKQVSKTNKNNAKPKNIANKQVAKNNKQKEALHIRRSRQNPQQTIKNTNNKKVSQSRNNFRVIKNIASTHRPKMLLHDAIKGLKRNPGNNETLVIGQKIIKQVLGAFQKVIRNEMAKLEENHRKKLAGSLDCGKVNKRDKRTYNDKSKAASRNKNKYQRMALVQENYTKARSKRNIEIDDRRHLENVSVISLIKDANSVIPLNAQTQKVEPLTYSNIDETIKTHTNGYYKYTMSNNISWTSTTEQVTKSMERNESYIGNITLLQAISDINNDSKAKVINETKYDAWKDISPNFNDLKFYDWHMIKLKKGEQKFPRITKQSASPNVKQAFEDMKNTENIYNMSELRKEEEVSQKQHSSSIMLRNRNNPSNKKQSMNETDVMGLKKVLVGLIKEINKTTTNKTHTKMPKKKFQMNILKYVRKFFRSLFSKPQTKNHKIYGLGTKEDHTLQVLCENIGKCIVKNNSKMLLKYKLSQLNKETKTVLKSIRTIKGLLHLFELPDCYKIYRTNKYNSFASDIQKLGAVLRESEEDNLNNSYTFTQKQQIHYIKLNTQTFIDSVKMFAEILSDILKLISTSFDSDPHFETVPITLHSTPKRSHSNKTEKILNKIKNMLHKYNIMQNKFMKNMYDIINAGLKNSTTTTTQNPRQGESFDHANSKHRIIDKYSNNIIEKLKKLKTIVNVLNHKRTKRDTFRGDDALDYMLTLMEFLVRQKLPMGKMPAKDGIDLLIDAIKNAPDIKPINYKINNTQNSIYETNNDILKIKDGYKETSIFEADNDVAKRKDEETNEKNSSESDSDSKKISNEDSEVKETKPENETENIEYKLEQDENNSNDVTQNVYFRVFHKDTESYNNLEITTKATDAKKQLLQGDDKTAFDKLETYINDPKKIEVFTAFVEDDSNADADTIILQSQSSNETTKSPPLQIGSTKNLEKTTQRFILSKDSDSESQDSEAGLNSHKTKLDWIEETFDREIKEFSINASKNNPVRTTQPQAYKLISKPTTKSFTKKLHNENKSAIAKEIIEDSDGNSKKEKKILKKKKVYDEVMNKKQMQLLSSLDYGTEKSTDFEEPYAKDDMRSEDSEAAYFV